MHQRHNRDRLRPGPPPEGEGERLPNVDIEWIVCEVIRRLRELDELNLTNGHETKQPTATPRIAGSLEITDRIVTLESLNNRLSGVERVVVPSRAIVTPAVVDELNDRGVTLVRGAAGVHSKQNATVPSPRRGPLVAVAVENFDAAALAKQLGGEIAVVNRSSHDCADALDDVAGHIEQDNLAVLLSHAPVTAVVTANRNPRVRAAIGFNYPAVRQAVDEAGANMLVIDPSGRSISELAGMIGEFFRRSK